MTVENIDIPGPEGAIDATLHLPEGEGPWPGVLMLPDIRGPRDAFFQMADTLASHGYAVLLPNVYYRFGRAPVPDLDAPFPHPDTMAALMALKETLTPERARIDMRTLVRGMGTLPEIAKGRIAVVGYCMTGSFALRAAAACPDAVGVAASYHGGNLVTDDAESPHLLAPAIAAIVYLGHATDDAQMPPEHIARIEEAFEKAGLRFRSEVFPGGHGFAVPGPRYHEESDRMHWRTLLETLSLLPRA